MSQHYTTITVGVIAGIAITVLAFLASYAMRLGPNCPQCGLPTYPDGATACYECFRHGHFVVQQDGSLKSQLGPSGRSLDDDECRSGLARQRPSLEPANPRRLFQIPAGTSIYRTRD